MKFEYDPNSHEPEMLLTPNYENNCRARDSGIFMVNKSKANMDKHGIDFDEAQNLWVDEYKVLFPVVLNGEDRVLIVARYRGKHWTAVYTMRGEKIKIISVRRSRSKERSVL